MHGHSKESKDNNLCKGDIEIEDYKATASSHKVTKELKTALPGQPQGSASPISVKP